MKKKYLSFILAAAMAACGMTACGGSAAGNEDGLQIVTTIFPEYDWVMNILGENPGNAEVSMLLDSGVDLHSYQPAAQDIMKISTCDIFIYVGGESDSWVDDALNEAVNKDMKVINLLELLGEKAKEEEIVEGMEADHEHEDEDHADGETGEDHDDADAAGEDHDDTDAAEEDHEDEHHDEDPEYDEHVWLSLKNASALVEGIAEVLEDSDPANADAYASNTAAYQAELSALDAEYEAAVSKALIDTVLFGDRFPFRYMTDDYDLDYYAAFAGCSAETEASFETILFLANKVDELSLPAVLTIEGSDQRIAETIVQSTKTKDQKILSLDSMQATTKKDVESGTHYLEIMEKNLSVLKEALQ